MAKKFTYSGLQAKRKENARVQSIRNARRRKTLGRSKGSTGGSRIRILP
jgi:hypothetical protein